MVENQAVPTTKHKFIFQVEIDMNLCFCSENLCNDPNGELLGKSGAIPLAATSSFSTLLVIASLWMQP